MGSGTTQTRVAMGECALANNEASSKIGRYRIRSIRGLGELIWSRSQKPGSWSWCRRISAPSTVDESYILLLPLHDIYLHAFRYVYQAVAEDHEVV